MTGKTSTMTPRVLAKKSLGQNFLVNQGVLARIVAAADIGAGDTVLEIGPGTGALTEHLVRTGARIIAIEKDHRLIGPLRQRFPTVELIEGDALRIHPPCDAIVANIPYYLTSRLIRLITETWRPSRAVLMVQYEVARRMMAVPSDMNLLALSVQLYAEPNLVMRVSRGSFRPVPDVDSAVVRLDMRPDADRELNERVMAMAKKAFARKRKQLGFGPRPSARPQELSVEDWKNLAC